MLGVIVFILCLLLRRDLGGGMIGLIEVKM